MLKRFVHQTINKAFQPYMTTKTHPKKFKFAAIQLQVGSNKLENLQRAKNKIKEAAENGAHVISLPVCADVQLEKALKFYY